MKLQPIQRLTAALSFSLLLGVAGSLARAQSTTGSIYGTVTDATAAALPRATVTATDVQTNEKHIATSNASGDYVFQALTPGDYELSAQIAGFQIEKQTGVRLDANQNVHVSFALKAGSTEQTVTVVASTTLVDTRESQVGQTINQRQLQELPLNGRDPRDLSQLIPGVTNYTNSSIAGLNTGDPVGASFSTNGLRTFNNSYYIDGASDTDIFRGGGMIMPNPDALQEFRVLTSNFDAEFGSMPGAVVNVITRSGSNQFHGLAYDYLRNNILNAKNYFQTTVTPLKQNQFGGNFGGPILHNRLFFFGSYQGLRVRTSTQVASTALTVPTAAERTGDFRADKVIPTCGTTTYPCGGTPGLIPAGYLDPVVQNMLKSVPVALSFNGTAGGYPAGQIASANVSEDQYSARGDYQLGSHHQLSAFYFRSNGSTQLPNSHGSQVFAWSGAIAEAVITNLVGTDTWILSPNALNSLRLYYTGIHLDNANEYTTNTLADLGATIPEARSVFSQPGVVISGFWSMGAGTNVPSIYNMPASGLFDTFNLTHGNHTIKLGGSVAWNKFGLNSENVGSGQYTVSSTAPTGNVLANFILGKATSFIQNYSIPTNLHHWDPALFVQDDWRVAKQLTLNLGLRWEVYAPYVGQNDDGTFAPNVQSQRFPTAPTGVLISGDPGVPDGVLKTTYDKFSPRVGFAFDVFGNGRTSIRGGYGLFFSGVQASFYASLAQAPFALQETVNSTQNFVNPYTSVGLTDPFPYTPNLTNPVFPAGLSFAAMSPGDKAVPYVNEYNLTLEQQLGTNWGVRLAYVGNSAHKFYVLLDENSPIYSPTGSSSSASILARRPYKPTSTSYVFGAIDELAPYASSSYNSLQATLTHNFVHRFSLTANYVWSKDMTNASSDPGAITTFTVIDMYNLSYDYGRSDLDVHQRFTASYLWQSPDIHRWGYLGTQALSGWRLNGITTLASGPPFTVRSGSDTNLDGVSTDVPNVIASPFLSGLSRAAKIAGYFNKAAFTAVPAGTPYGNEQRDFLTGPSLVQTDLSASKLFPIWKESSLMFRADVFNVFNNVNLGTPASSLSNSATLGKISSAGNPRVVQFALKYQF